MPPVYRDDFGNSASGWPVRDLSAHTTSYDNGNYRIEVKLARIVAMALPGISCSDCTIQVEAWRDSGADSAYGVFFGVSQGTGQFYLFRVQPGRQEYALQRYTGSEWITLVGYTYSEQIHPLAAHNRLLVKRSGIGIDLYMNGQQLASITDSAYLGSLRVGVAAISGPSAPVVLRYDDFTVWGPGYEPARGSAGESKTWIIDAPLEYDARDRP